MSRQIVEPTTRALVFHPRRPRLIFMPVLRVLLQDVAVPSNDNARSAMKNHAAVQSNSMAWRSSSEQCTANHYGVAPAGIPPDQAES